MEQKRFGSILRQALSRPVEDGAQKERLRALGYEGTWMDLLTQAQVERAAKGDTAAFRLVRDTMDGQEEPVTEEALKHLPDETLRAMLERREET